MAGRTSSFVLEYRGVSTIRGKDASLGVCLVAHKPPLHAFAERVLSPVGCLMVIVLAVVLVVASPSSGRADEWSGRFVIGGVAGEVDAVALDAGGNLYVGGGFAVTNGGVTANYIAKWDGDSWSALGTGMNASVKALAVDASGNLYAGGDFTTAGGVANTSYIAKWDGSSWSPLGTGMNWIVNALAFDASGNLYAGGRFTMAGGVPANYIAKWDGSSWSALGSGVNDQVCAIAVYGSNVYAGGRLWMSASCIAKWDGSSWSPLGTGLQSYVLALAVDSSGNLYAGGQFTTTGGVPANYIAKWDGSSWSALGSGMNNVVKALVVDSVDNLYAGGHFTTAGGGSAHYIAKWDGSSWSVLGSEVDYFVYTFALDGGGNVYAGGLFSMAGGIPVYNIAKWNGSSWFGLGNGELSGTVNAFASDGNGNLYAGGWFTTAGGVLVNNIAKWDGSSWSALGSGMNGKVHALAVDANGNVYAGGEFTTAGGVSVNKIAKWDGSSWSALSSGMNDIVNALAVDGDGNLYAGGQFSTAGGKTSERIGCWMISAFSLSIQSTGGNPASVSPIPIRFSFLRAVTGFTMDDIDVVNGTKSDFAVLDAKTYSVNVTPTCSDCTVTITVLQGMAIDSQGNSNSSATLDVVYSPPTLVALLYFKAIPTCSGITLKWETTSEIGSAGFCLWRMDEPGGQYIKITQNLIPGSGGVTQGAAYTWKDAGVTASSSYSYRLEEIDLAGVSTFYGPAYATAGMIALLHPQRNEELSAGSPPIFHWSTQTTDLFKIQFSIDPRFHSMVITLPATPVLFGLSSNNWITRQSYCPISTEWLRIVRLARNSRPVYWRVYGEDAAGNNAVSKARKLRMPGRASRQDMLPGFHFEVPDGAQ